MPLKKTQYEPLRWSERAARHEFRVPYSRMRRCLEANNIEPGPDGKYSTQQIATALFNHKNPLEQKAKNARWEAYIQQAELKKQQLEALQARLVPRDVAEKLLKDLVAVVAETIRRNPNVSPTEKRQWIEEMSETVDRFVKYKKTRKAH
jgi:signal recognition particle GTPase